MDCDLADLPATLLESCAGLRQAINSLGSFSEWRDLYMELHLLEQKTHLFEAKGEVFARVLAEISSLQIACIRHPSLGDWIEATSSQDADVNEFFRSLSFFGAGMDDEAAERHRVLNERLLALYVKYQNNAAKGRVFPVSSTEAYLVNGLSERVLSEHFDPNGDGWRFTGADWGLTRMAHHPLFRDELMELAASRGGEASADNRLVLLEILGLKTEIAALLLSPTVSEPSHAKLVEARTGRAIDLEQLKKSALALGTSVEAERIALSERVGLDVYTKGDYQYATSTSPQSEGASSCSTSYDHAIGAVCALFERITGFSVSASTDRSPAHLKVFNLLGGEASRTLTLVFENSGDLSPSTVSFFGKNETLVWIRTSANPLGCEGVVSLLHEAGHGFNRLSPKWTGLPLSGNYGVNPLEVEAYARFFEGFLYIPSVFQSFFPGVSAEEQNTTIAGFHARQLRGRLQDVQNGILDAMLHAISVSSSTLEYARAEIQKADALFDALDPYAVSRNDSVGALKSLKLTSGFTPSTDAYAGLYSVHSWGDFLASEAWRILRERNGDGGEEALLSLVDAFILDVFWDTSRIGFEQALQKISECKSDGG